MRRLRISSARALQRIARGTTAAASGLSWLPDLQLPQVPASASNGRRPMATRRATAKKRPVRAGVKTVTLADLQTLSNRSGASVAARDSAQKKYDAKWDKFEKKTMKKIDKDIKK